MIWTTDAEILEAVKRVAAEVNMSPSAFIMMGHDRARWLEHSLIPIFGPQPCTMDEAEITPEISYSLPEWVGALAPIGSKRERLHWPDGSITVRLVNPHAVVLATAYLPPQAIEAKT